MKSSSQQKHLHELLREEQEPFLLHDYIADNRKTLLKTKSTILPHKCFLLSLTNSPDPRKSPLFRHSTTPPKSPMKPPSPILLHILDAAIRIQKQSFGNDKTVRVKNRFGLVGSLFRRLVNGNRKNEIVDDKIDNVNDSRSPWSERSRSDDTETSTSTSTSVLSFGDGDFDEDKRFYESPFRFVLCQSPSPSCRTPEFSSPAMSPSRFSFQGKEKNKYVDGIKKLEDEEEEEEKQQLSPVSVLDPTFVEEDDEDGDRIDHSDFDHDCSYVLVLKQQVDDSDSSDSSDSSNFDIINDVMSKSSIHHPSKIAGGTSKLISDLIEEARREQNSDSDDESIGKRVSERLESWKEVEMNTIDMMVEEDYKKDVGEWKRSKKQATEIATGIEVGILELLVEELSQCLDGM